MPPHARSFDLPLDDHALRVRTIAAADGAGAHRPTLVFLHDSLGCITVWRDFPERLAAALGCDALVYDRRGYGASSPFGPAPRAPGYLEDEADVLARVLDACGVQEAVLFGHSDGGSIALIHAGHHPVTGLALLAPHVIVEDITVAAIRETRARFVDGDLRPRLQRHHADVDAAFWGWCDVWLDPGFRDWTLEPDAEQVRCPTLLIQGEDDPYGTLDQLDRIQARVRGPVERLVVPGGHSPHVEAADAVVAAIAAFAAELA